jgi:hypothetical protein
MHIDIAWSGASRDAFNQQFAEQRVKTKALLTFSDTAVGFTIARRPISRIKLG